MDLDYEIIIEEKKILSYNRRNTVFYIFFSPYLVQDFALNVQHCLMAFL